MIAPFTKGKMIITENLLYYTKYGRFEVPSGFVFDGATIPRLFWILGCPFEPVTLKAVIIHDYLYKTGLLRKTERDLIFYHELIESGAWLKAGLYYTSVRIYQEIKNFF